MKVLTITLELYEENEEKDYYADISEMLGFEWGTVTDIKEERND